MSNCFMVSFKFDSGIRTSQSRQRQYPLGLASVAPRTANVVEYLDVIQMGIFGFGITSTPDSFVTSVPTSAPIWSISYSKIHSVRISKSQ